MRFHIKIFWPIKDNFISFFLHPPPPLLLVTGTPTQKEDNKTNFIVFAKLYEITCCHTYNNKMLPN